MTEPRTESDPKKGSPSYTWPRSRGPRPPASHSFLLPVLLPNTVNAGWEYFVLCHAAGERTGKWYTSPRGLLNISGDASLLGIQRSKQNRKVTDVHNFKTQIVENS